MVHTLTKIYISTHWFWLKLIIKYRFGNLTLLQRGCVRQRYVVAIVLGIYFGLKTYKNNYANNSKELVFELVRVQDVLICMAC